MGSSQTKSDPPQSTEYWGNVDEEVEELVRPIFKNGRYANPFSTWEEPSFLRVMKMIRSKDNSAIPWDNKEELDSNLPMVKPDTTRLNNPPADKMQMMWVGHATVLVQFDGLTLLTDPVFGKRCGPMGLLGPRRYRDPPCAIDDLPAVDAILVSHNHYDHLEHEAVVKLNNKFGDSVTWFVGQGTKTWMEAAGCKHVVELTWWGEHVLVKDNRKFTFAATPSQHWCKRTATDTNKALWCSWAVKGPSQSFYFAGDTGYCMAFKQIGRKYGPFTLSAIPIGAYEPRWFMRAQHVNPEEAVQVHEDIRSQSSVGIHWGTFRLTTEHYMEPKLKLGQLLEEKGLRQDCFFTVKHGEVITLNTS